MTIDEIARARWTFADELDRRVHEDPDKVFLWFDDTPLTFAAARHGAHSAANQLLALGVVPGDTVALLTVNCPEWVCTWLACAQIGAVSMPINVMFRGEFLRHQLADSEARVMLVDAQFLPQLVEVLDELPALETIVVRGPIPEDITVSSRVRTVDAALLGDGPIDAVHGGSPFAWNDAACLFYTSGTTGPSKGALLTQQYLCVAARVLADWYGYRDDDVMYAAVPLFHLSGAYGVVAGSLVSGRTAILDTAFSVSGCWDRVRKYDATIFLGVGPMVAMLMAQPPDPRDVDLPVRLIVAAPIPAGMQAAVEARFGCTVVQAYGQTEAIPVAMHHVGGASAPGSAGPCGPLHEVRILDDEDGEVGQGEVGEIAIRPRYPHVMFEGYRNRPETTLQQMRNLWFHTGDLGRIDDQGNLWWVDRKKDSIRRRGENISSFEVEQAVLTHPAVVECAAHAVPSDIGEDEVKICVVLAEGATLEPAELRDHCTATMPSFAVPRYVELTAALPKNVIGRVQKHVLRDRPLGPETWDAAAAGAESRA